MIPGLVLSDLAVKWKEQLIASTSILTFCQTKYDQRLRLFVGVDPALLPSATDCPYIIIQPVLKSEGMERKHYRYTISVKWAVVNPEKIENNGVSELMGLYECDHLGQLILNEISKVSPANPISYVKYQLPAEEMNTYPRFEGSMEIKVDAVPSLGSVLKYP
jgi:hypothetical protein